MTTPIPDISVTVLEGPALDDAVTSLHTDPAASPLWESLTASGYSPQLASAGGATVTQQSRGRGYSYISIPFATPQGATARLVWDDLMGGPRAAYGLPTTEAGSLTRVDVHQSVNDQVQLTNSLVRGTGQDVELLDATGHLLQVFPFGQPPQTSAGAAIAAAVSDCSICQTVVDILYGVVACGGVAQYFLCNFVCDVVIGLPTAGIGAVICAIACGILVGLCCYLTGNALKQAACKTWCD
jgi:uncharacterized membrane protein